MRNVILGAFVLVSCIGARTADHYTYMNGQQLLEQCGVGVGNQKAHMSKDQKADYLFCLGYVAGAMDVNATAVANGEVHRTYCLPQERIEVGRAVYVTVNWLQEHPETLRKEGNRIVWRALADSFPCR